MKERGSRAQVMHGTARRTSGGLRKKDLKYNKHGRIVSRRMSLRAKKEKRLERAGYKTKKGVFGSFKKSKRSSGRRSRRRSRRRRSRRRQRGGHMLDVNRNYVAEKIGKAHKNLGEFVDETRDDLAGAVKGAVTAGTGAVKDAVTAGTGAVKNAVTAGTGALKK